MYYNVFVMLVQDGNIPGQDTKYQLLKDDKYWRITCNKNVLTNTCSLKLCNTTMYLLYEYKDILTGTW